VPTFAELGYKGIEGVGRYGFFAPAGTPKATVERLAAAIGRAMQSPDLRERFGKLGLDPHSSGPESFAKVLAADATKWGPVVKASGYTGD
jgi:tripartite-type tricarboxylate transporter receptor subunit TctC